MVKGLGIDGFNILKLLFYLLTHKAGKEVH
jgi:hypothetical protein